MDNKPPSQNGGSGKPNDSYVPALNDSSEYALYSNSRSVIDVPAEVTTSPLSGGEESVGQFHLKDALAVVWRRRWIFVGCVLFIFLLSAFRTFSKTPIFEAQVLLRIEPANSNILSGLQELGNRYDRFRFYETHYQMLNRRSLAKEVVTRMELDKPILAAMERRDQTPGLKTRLIEGIRSMLGTRTLMQPEIDLEIEAFEAATNWVIGSTFVRPGEMSELVRLVFTGTDPQMATNVVNELAKVYVEENIETRSAAYQYASEFLDKELKESQKRLEAYEQEMREYSGGRDEIALTQRQEMAEARLLELQTSLAASERQVLQLKAEIDLARENPSVSPGIQNSRLIEELSVEVNRTKLERDILAREYGKENPDLKRLERRLEGLSAQYVEGVATVLDVMTTNYNVAQENYRTLKEAFDKQALDVNKLEDSLLQYRIMAQQTESERDTYQRLLDRSKEINIQKGLAVNNVQIVEPAVRPNFPAYPRIGRSLILGAIAAMVLGLGMVFFVEYMDRSIKSPEQLETFVGLPCLAVVPSIAQRSLKTEAGESVPQALATAKLPNSPIAETFRYLRTSVVYSMAGRVPQVLIVSSSLPSEGKTTVSINLSSAFAQRGARVLVIDGDLKRPSCHKVFGLDRRVGLSAVLTGQASINDAIVPTEIEGMDFMPAGPITPNPADLLDSAMMRETMEKLRSEYDHIIIDSAPLAGMADSYIQASFADGVILVVEQSRTPRDLVRKIRLKLASVNAQVLGAVLNAKRSGRRHRSLLNGPSYDYNYGAGYSYRYQYTSGRPEVDTVRPSQISPQVNLPESASQSSPENRAPAASSTNREAS
jgi:capsular exopolysaccharide synthesis family protein